MDAEMNYYIIIKGMNIARLMLVIKDASATTIYSISSIAW